MAYVRGIDGFRNEGGVAPDFGRTADETLGHVAEVKAGLDAQPLLGHQRLADR